MKTFPRLFVAVLWFVLPVFGQAVAAGEADKCAKDGGDGPCQENKAEGGRQLVVGVYKCVVDGQIVYKTMASSAVGDCQRFDIKDNHIGMLYHRSGFMDDVSRMASEITAREKAHRFSTPIQSGGSVSTSSSSASSSSSSSSSGEPCDSRWPCDRNQGSGSSQPYSSPPSPSPSPPTPMYPPTPTSTPSPGYPTPSPGYPTPSPGYPAPSPGYPTPH